MAPCSRFACAFAVVAIACVSFAVVESRNMRRSVSLRQVDSNASLASEVAKLSEAFQDSLSAGVNATNNTIANIQNTISGITSNSTDALNILSQSTNQTITNIKTYVDKINASSVKAFQAFNDSATKIFQTSAKNIRNWLALLG